MVVKIVKVGHKLLEYLKQQLVLKYKIHLILKKSIYLKLKRWEIFTNYKEELTKDEYRMLYLTGIKCKGNHKAGTEEFFSISGKRYLCMIIRLYVNQYSKMVGHFLVN